MGGVVVVRKVTRVLKLDKGFGDILQVGDGWSGPAREFSMDNILGCLFHAAVIECTSQFRPMIIASPVAHCLSD
jgi:hypothetical protein